MSYLTEHSNCCYLKDKIVILERSFLETNSERRGYAYTCALDNVLKDSHVCNCEIFDFFPIIVPKILLELANV